jgi:dipeptidyl aminopeptidase/acylaminoacyl peptidase
MALHDALDGTYLTALPESERLRSGEVREVHWTGSRELVALFDEGVQSWILDRGDAPRLADSMLTAIEHLEVLADGRIAMVASRPHHAREVYAQLEPDGPPQRLTNSNPWLADVDLGPQEVVRYTARDALRIEGLLIHPPGDAAESTPLVIVAHGGPEAHYTNGWITRYSEPGQVLAGMGYRVWYPNYRSSTGYGVEFAKADHGDPMGKEFLDHLDAIEHFAELGLIDRDRIGIIGGSYGGYTAAWAATRHSEHFAAAVSFVPFVDIRTKWLTSDIPWEFYLVHYQEQWPHEQPGFLADRSPLTWAAHCDTPLLLCGGDADPRVHPSQPFMLYRAVKFATDTPVRYVQYPGEGHGNRTNVYRYDYMLRGIRWLDWYLKEPNRRDAEMPPKDLEYPAWQ